jgi:hypothetical protein
LDGIDYDGLGVMESGLCRQGGSGQHENSQYGSLDQRRFPFLS